MRKRAVVAMLAEITMIVAGCANIQDERTRTQTEGTVVGSGIGAGIGAVIGGLSGGHRGALQGAGIGAVVGGIGGFLTGRHIANKKSEYASQEDWLDDCIASARQTNSDVARYNADLRQEIDWLDRESARLVAEYEDYQTESSALAAEHKKVQEYRQQLRSDIASLKEEIAANRQIVEDVQAERGRTSKSVAMMREVDEMEQHLAELERCDRQLASISWRLSS